MIRITTTLAVLAALATPAMAQGWTYQTTPLGNGFSITHAQGPNGHTATGTTVPYGEGWSITDWRTSAGQNSTCTTVPTGGGFSTTRCTQPLE